MSKKVSAVTFAYAKINVGLLVKEKREDGLHNIETFFQLINLADIISYELRESEELKIEIKRKGENASYLKEGETDIMEKAALSYYKELKHPFSLELEIEKNIFPSSGLGGGSADAAAVLSALNSYFSYPFKESKMLQISQNIGADVPFFYSLNRAAKAKGIGELIYPCHSLEYPYLTLVYPEKTKESTKEMYKALDSINRDFTLSLPSSIDGELKRDVFINDFEKVGKNKEILSVIKKVSSGNFYSLSGSGPSFYILSENKEKAEEIANKEELALFRTLVVSPL